MLKLGLTAPSTRKIQPTAVEQTQMLIDHGVAPENIYDSKVELLERVESEADPVEVVVSSLSRWGTQFKDKREGIEILQARSGSLTVLTPPRSSL